MSDVVIEVISSYGRLTLEKRTYPDESYSFWIKADGSILIGLSNQEVAEKEFRDYVEIEKRYER